MMASYVETSMFFRIEVKMTSWVFGSVSKTSASTPSMTTSLPESAIAVRAPW